MSELKVNKITPKTGTSIQLGESGDTITIPCGATLTNNGTASGFGLSFCTTVKSSPFTATANKGFLINTGSAVTVTLPSSPNVGDQIIIIDATGRTLNYAKPKWLRYTGEADVYVAGQGEPNGIAVIVEDVISANTICSVCQNVTGIALLGTSMSVKHIEYIQDYTKIIMALDPDASNKNLQYRREIVSWTGINTIAMRLKNDIKYKEEEDISLLKTLCNLSG